MLRAKRGWSSQAQADGVTGFNGHPPLGVNATRLPWSWVDAFCIKRYCFNGHPPLGVNATVHRHAQYPAERLIAFQWAPTLGGECYKQYNVDPHEALRNGRFNGHPPLGVNATRRRRDAQNKVLAFLKFQWAPTLGGECYSYRTAVLSPRHRDLVSMGTHPWG